MESETAVRLAAVERVARLFGGQPNDVRMDAVFGVDLKPTFKSDFRYNELDRIDFDFRDVASPEIAKELASGATTIWTVQDYCEHMVRCYAKSPAEVLRVLAK